MKRGDLVTNSSIKGNKDVKSSQGLENIIAGEVGVLGQEASGPRPDGRQYDQLRPVKITRNYTMHSAGSVLIEVGNTKVICTASVEEGVPGFMKGTGRGWISAEYSMLPSATETRKRRDSSKGRIDGRSQEIQRLIGRSIRSVVNLDDLGERTIWIDCDVIQADGGTRTASITGAFVALADALYKLYQEGLIKTMPVTSMLAAVSVGVVDSQVCLDICYQEDSNAEVDTNIIMNNKGEFVELQCTGEEVRVVKMGDCSVELCGGTHLDNTSQVGMFKILSESGVAAGVRRIEAITGRAVYQYILAKDSLINSISDIMKTREDNLVAKANSLVDENKQLEKEAHDLKSKMSMQNAGNALEDSLDIKGVKLLTAKYEDMDMDTLREVADNLRDKLGTSVVVLANVAGDKINFVATASKDAIDKGAHAGNIVREVAKIAGGKGGGRPNMAQAGGSSKSQ